MKEIYIQRIYEDSKDKNAYRILVDRIWPRGISKEKADLDEWKKELAPSTELRKWFDHKAERFTEFSKRYQKELKDKTEELKAIKKIAKEKPVCLLFGAKDEKHNQAVILKEVLKSL